MFNCGVVFEYSLISCVKELPLSDEIVAVLAKYIAGEFLKQPDRDIDLNEPLLSSGMIDSFHLVDLGMYVEDHFGVRIDDDELNASTFDTLAQLAALIRSRKQG